jgi:S-adenosyl methyltransferase
VANRGFPRRAARYLAEHGIDQFIDLGSGLPTQNNTDEVARRVNPDARVVFVDTDPLVLEHGNQLERDTVRAVRADIRHPHEVLADPAMGLIDFDRPAGLLLVAVLYFVTDEYDRWGIVRTYMDALPSGGYPVVAHLNGDGLPEHSVQSSRRSGPTRPPVSDSGHGRRSRACTTGSRCFPRTRGAAPSSYTGGVEFGGPGAGGQRGFPLGLPRRRPETLTRKSLAQ